MNNLHRDLLTESASEYRDQLLQTTVATSRRTRRTRALAKAAAASSVCIMAAILIFSPYRDSQQPIAQAAPPSAPSASSAVNQTTPTPLYTVIYTEPFTSLLHTTPLPSENHITVASSIKILDAAPQPDITPISDDQLLALFEGKPVMLVAGPRGKELVLLETEARVSN